MSLQGISVEKIQQAAVTYDPVLRYLPHVELESFIQEMHFNLQTVTEEDRIINMRRRGDLLRPYRGRVSKEAGKDEILRPEESVLSPRMGYLTITDNIQNYRDKKLLMKEGRTLTGENKKHPYEYEILKSIVKTFVEDFTLAIPHAKEELDNDTSPLTIFDGYNAIIDRLVGETKISGGKGNLIEVDNLVPHDETEAEKKKPLDALIGFVRALNPMLRSGALDIIVPMDTLNYILDAFELRRVSQGDISREKLAEFVRDKCGLGQTPSIISNPIIGKGTRLIATRPGNITVGVSAPADMQFVQVRSVYEDPNLVQYWMQAQMGVRIDNWNSKMFAVSNGTITFPTGLEGDYRLKEIEVNGKNEFVEE